MAQSGHRLVALHMSAFGGKADMLRCCSKAAPTRLGLSGRLSAAKRKGGPEGGGSGDADDGGMADDCAADAGALMGPLSVCATLDAASPRFKSAAKAPKSRYHFGGQRGQRGASRGFGESTESFCAALSPYPPDTHASKSTGLHKTAQGTHFWDQSLCNRQQTLVGHSITFPVTLYASPPNPKLPF